MQIKLWENPTGRSPVLKFIRSIPVNHGQRIIKDIEQLEKFGIDQLIEGSSKLKLLRGKYILYQLTTKIQGMSYRVLIYRTSSEAWLVEAFKKKTNKTPRIHIENSYRRIEAIQAQLA